MKFGKESYWLMLGTCAMIPHITAVAGSTRNSIVSTFPELAPVLNAASRPMSCLLNTALAGEAREALMDKIQRTTIVTEIIT